MKKRKLAIRRETLSIATREPVGGLTGSPCNSVVFKCFHTAEATCFGCVTTVDTFTQG
jgi:hypothetical protein